ncbi:MAG TPA: hypothetical protein VGR72_12195 [Candidatus Acidoferrales bacterium]|nr:hypothetical protein [Candidatus Acidoferrales bacterium]
MNRILNAFRNKAWRLGSPAAPQAAVVLSFLTIVVAFGLLAPRTFPQSDPQEDAVHEIVANLNAGRAVIAVAKDGIVIATLEDPIEPATRPPAIIELSGERVAVLLGAVDWWLPEERRELSQLETELPRLPSTEGPAAPVLNADSRESGEALDIEGIANRLHGQLNWIADHIHGNLHLPGDQPIAEMLLADYAHDYGPEVWLIQYSFEQEQKQGDFWQTRALPPQYTQLWPPQKGQPHALIEVSYPPDQSTPTLQQLLGSDSRIGNALTAQPELRNASQAVLNSGVNKLTAVDVAALLRTTLGAIAPPNARMVEAEINEKLGVGWFVRPPAFPEAPGTIQARPPGAPSLLSAPKKPGGPG